MDFSDIDNVLAGKKSSITTEESANPDFAEPVRLEPHEMGAAIYLGKRRQFASRNSKNAHGHSEDQEKGEQTHIEGAGGEIAFAKFIGHFHPMHVNTYRRLPDVYRYEVRFRSKQWYDLIVRDDDSDDAIFVLVNKNSEIANLFYIVGFILAGDAKKHPEWRNAHGQRELAYFVPKDQLRTPQELKKMYLKHRIEDYKKEGLL